MDNYDVNYLIKLGMNKQKAIGGIPFYYVEYPINKQENYNLFNKSIYPTNQFTILFYYSSVDAKPSLLRDTVTYFPLNLIYLQWKTVIFCKYE